MNGHRAPITILFNGHRTLIIIRHLCLHVQPLRSMFWLDFKRMKGGQLYVGCGWKLCNCSSIKQGDTWKGGREDRERMGWEGGDEQPNELWRQVFASNGGGRLKLMVSIWLPSPSKSWLWYSQDLFASLCGSIASLCLELNIIVQDNDEVNDDLVIQ